MKDVGIARVSISIDFPNAAEHDEFRGVPGAFDGAVRGIRNCLDAGVEVQINSTITKLNAHYLPALLQLAEDLGAVSFHPFMLVPTGRGKELEEQELPPEEYERALEWMYDAQQESDLFMKPTDVPHYWRVMRQRAKAQGRKLEVHPHSHGGMNTLSRGCLAGIGFCFISHIGDVQGCGYFDKVAGNVREQTFPEVWRDSPLFNELRDFDGLKGKCGACEFKKVCGGCRARAYEATGDYMAEEPYCAYVPQGLVRAGERLTARTDSHPQVEARDFAPGQRSMCFSSSTDASVRPGVEVELLGGLVGAPRCSPRSPRSPPLRAAARRSRSSCRPMPSPRRPSVTTSDSMRPESAAWKRPGTMA